MRGVPQVGKRGLYRRIPVLAKIIGVDQVDVVAAAKVTGATVIPGMIFFPNTITPDFVEEAWLAYDMRQSAAARRNASNAPGDKTAAKNRGFIQ